MDRSSIYADDAVFAVFDFQREDEAKVIATSAWQALAEGCPDNPLVHEKRLLRLETVRRAFRDQAVERIAMPVAQWLSAKAAPVAVRGAGEALDVVPDLRKRAAIAKASLDALSAALVYADAVPDGKEAQELAQLIASSLSEVERTLATSSEWASRLAGLLPAGARGRFGVIGALTHRNADEALAKALGDLWLGQGLTLAGGEDGHGIDVVVGKVIRDRKAAEKALASARRSSLE